MRCTQAAARICLALVFITTLIQVCVWYILKEYPNSNNISSCSDADNNLHIWLEDIVDGCEVHDRINSQLSYVPFKIRERPVIIYQPEDMTNMPLGFRTFQKNQCIVQNCFLTNDVQLKKRADIVYFSPASSISLNFQRPLGQIWVLQLLESPENTDSLRKLNHRINYTVGYRWDSDFVSPYAKWVSFHTAPLMKTNPLVNYAEGKRGKVAWFVSHCLTRNKRREYALQLQKYVKVDVFGDCGTRRISKAEGKQLLRNHYKFYLSFENSNCRDYVTEKFFENALMNDVIPIAMGAPRSFYERIAPPHSFLHVEDYVGPKELARHILELDNNDTLYNEYFLWKRNGYFVNTLFWCRFCSMMQSPRPKIYTDIDGWWRNPRDCLPAAYNQ